MPSGFDLSAAGGGGSWLGRQRRRRVLMSRAYRDDPAGVPASVFRRGFPRSVKPYRRDVRSGDAVQNRYGPERLIVHIDIGIGVRSSPVEAGLAPVEEKVWTEIMDQLVR